MGENKDSIANFKEKELIDKYEAALERAADQVYQSEMEDTNMAVLEIREVAEKYRYYQSDEEKKQALENCGWDTIKEWKETLIDLWMNPQE